MNEGYLRIFGEFDVNGDNVLTREEFISGLDKFNKHLQLTERQKIKLMEMADKDGNNSIDFQEFSKLLNEIDVAEEEEGGLSGVKRQGFLPGT